MMMPNEESSNINIDNYGSSRLLHDIEEISKALYLHDPPPPPPQHNHTPQKPNKNSPPKDNNKKSSIWKWKPLKALTHIRNHRLNSIFFLHIHSIDNLPTNFNDLNVCVYWKRKHEVLKSQSVRVHEGVAEFDEMLIHRCSVYVSKSGPHDDVAKYEPKLSLLYVSITGAPNLDLGKHWVDLTKFLPITLMELEEEKNRNGKWITSFELSGKAKGATINVSFGFSLSGNLRKIPDKGNLKSHNNNGSMLRRVGSIPSNSRRRTHGGSSLSLDMKGDDNGILPYEGPSITFLYELLDDPKSSNINEVNDGEFEVIDKGVEFVKDESKVVDGKSHFSKSFEDSCIETINVADLFEDDVDNIEVCKESTEESNFEELELFLHNLSISESPKTDFSFQENLFLEHDYDVTKGKMVKSRSLDDLTDTVVNDFMNFVNSESDPDSPREQLLREFEKETNFDFDLDNKEDEKDSSNIFDSSFLFQEPETENNDEINLHSLISRRKAKMVENLETEALMQEWGLNERLFENSPRTNSGAFGSPVYLSPERPPELPVLGEGLGSVLKTENGGFLRSMNPLIFKKAKNGERLIIQVSDSVVLPFEMGCDGLDILRKWATVGLEKMRLQVDSLMPMEDITGMTLQRARWKAELETEVVDRAEDMSTNICCAIDSEYISIENIVPLAIEKIQYLLIEGLRIQSGISVDVPPSSIPISASESNSEIQELIHKFTKLDSINFNNKHEELNNNFTLSLQLLLRDQLRDYEPVGIPMLALIHVEQSYLTNVDPTFKIMEVDVVGFKAEFGKKQQSGCRWLNSSGLTGNPKRHSLSTSNALVKSSIRSMNKWKQDEVLWSVSSYVHGEVAKWKELSGLNLYVRNPDIVFKS